MASEERKRPIDQANLATSSGPLKRPHLDRSASTQSSSPASPFRSNGSYAAGAKTGETAEEDESTPAYKGLEAFRKEAIYRQMREAKRDLGRSEDKVRRLEGLLASYDEKVEAFNQFWNILIEDIRLLSRNDAALGDSKSALMQAIPFTSATPDSSAFGRTVQDRSSSIKAVLTRLISLGPTSSPDVTELQGKCHEMAQESAALRSQLTTALAARDRVAQEVADLTQELRRAEKRLDRLHSDTVKATEKPSAKAEEEAEQAKVEAAEAEKKAAILRKQRAQGETEEAGEATAPANGIVAGGPSSDEMEDLQRVAEMRAHENEELRKEIVSLRQESEKLTNELQRMPDQRILESHLYTEVHQLFTHAKEEHTRIRQLSDKIEAENVDLRERRLAVEEAIKTEANAQVEQLQNQLKVHEADVTRLRDQRDTLQADVNEKRKREEVRFTQVDEMRALVSAKDTRIVTLRSEVRRLQMTLAAKSGDTKMLDKIKSMTNEVSQEEEADMEVISHLQARLRAAEVASDDLKRQLEARSSSTSDADLGAKVSKLQAELDRLQSIVGSASSGEDVGSLLKSQQDRIESMQLELDAANASTNALCDEVDKLGAAYSEMQRQANSKVLDVARMEDKMLRLTTEKSKADNKYFGAMRAKEAVENERRVALRNVEAQLKVIERYAEQETSFLQSVARHEAEVSGLRRLLEQQATRIADLEREVEASVRRERASGADKAQSEQVSFRRNSEWTDESRKRTEAEERVAKLERELERAKKQIAASGSKKKAGGGGSSGDDIQIEYLNSLLRCSACKERYRDRIITRCLHTFCQACVDARIQTRQRKCPHCGLGFSTSDVQTLFLQ